MTCLQRSLQLVERHGEQVVLLEARARPRQLARVHVRPRRRRRVVVGLGTSEYQTSVCLHQRGSACRRTVVRKSHASNRSGAIAVAGPATGQGALTRRVRAVELGLPHAYLLAEVVVAQAVQI